MTPINAQSSINDNNNTAFITIRVQNNLKIKKLVTLIARARMSKPLKM
ncbi:MAG: hypothetical protein JO297_01960 [Nitrososphaeraceae archaeon]|nr:hypothetical protein [Nitrososphaeraceae archaeon]